MSYNYINIVLFIFLSIAIVNKLNCMNHLEKYYISKS